MRVLLTSFEAFAGRKQNLSSLCTNHITNCFTSVDLSIDRIELPVEFDSSARIALKKIKNKNYDLIISIGETKQRSWIRLETTAHNIDHSPISPDNKGVTKNKSAIINKEKKSIGFLFPLDQFYCSLPKKIRNKTHISSTPGSYVCNNLAFHIATSTNIPYLFIHVPTTDCFKDISKLIERIGFFILSLILSYKKSNRISWDSNTVLKKSNKKKKYSKFYKALLKDIKDNQKSLSGS